MEILRVYVLPLVLAVSSVLLLAIETRALQIGRAARQPQWSRFIRRSVGAMCVAVIAFMLHFGSALPAPDAPAEVVHGQFYYWIAVLALVAFSVALAMWDALESVRSLKHHLERVQQDDLETLQEQIRKRGRKAR